MTSWRSEEDQPTIRGIVGPTNTHDGRKFRMLNVVDEFTHECLAIRVGRKLKSMDVIDMLSDLFILRGVAGHIRSDNVLRSQERRLTEQQISAREHALTA